MFKFNVAFPFGLRPVVTVLLACLTAAAAGAAALSAQGPVVAGPATRPGAVALRGMDLAGKVYTFDATGGAKAYALVVLSTDCPISNAYIPELNRLAGEASAAGGALFAVLSDPTVSRAKAAQYVKEYRIGFPVLFDASGEIAQRLRPTHTPEAFVLDRAGGVQYRGRVDDGWADLKKPRVAAQHHDLADAIAAVAAGRPVAVSRTETIGCYFEAWGADAAAVPAKVTFSRDVAPIVNANCVSCHRAGEVAPFALTSYDEAAKHAKQMARVTGERLMPPWKAEPGFGHFADERRLSDREVKVIEAWAAAGAPRGDEADLPPAPTFDGAWALGKPDVVIEMPKAFTVPASGRDVYRCFAMPIDIPADKYVVGFEFKPGATTVLHHCLLFLDDKGRARQMEAASTDGQPGYRSFGGVGFQPSGGLGGWAPGALPFRLPDGVGKPIHKGADVVFQVHYHPDGKEHQDRSKVAIYFAQKPIQKVAISIPLGNRQIDIPAGEKHYVRTAQIIAPTDVTLIGVTPHMHLVGRDMKVQATTPSGEVIPIIWVKDWDFRWQDQYRFVEPVHIPRGSKVTLEATYDNSSENPSNPNSPPQRVTFGEQTTNEMCYAFLQVTVDGQVMAAARAAGNGAGNGAGRPALLDWLRGKQDEAK